MPDATQLAQEVAALQLQLAQRSRSLADAEARYNAVFNSALSLMCICTTNGIILDVNHAALQALGLPIEALVGKHLWESPWFAQNPAEAAKVEAAIRRNRGQYVEYESRVAAPSGAWRLCQFILRPYRSYVGSEARFLVLEVRDITDIRPAAPARGAFDPTTRLSRALPEMQVES